MAQREDSNLERESRFASHALVDLRRFKYLPLGVHSAVLLDISLGGFKVEFVGEANSKPGEQFWVAIPLSPLGIYSPTRLICKGECRWFDGKRFRLGGVFKQLGKAERQIIDQIIETLKQRGTKPT